MLKWSWLLVLAALFMAAAFLVGMKVGSASSVATLMAQSADAATPATKAESRPAPALPAQTPATVEATPVATPAVTATPVASAAPANEDRLEKYYGNVFTTGARSAKLVALTFDDGPSAAYNQRFIETLQKEKATATFFMIGTSVVQNPAMVKNTSDAGFEIGLHSMTHLNPAHATTEKMEKEITGEAELLQGITGKRPCLYRPPYGAITRAEREITKQNKLVLVNWSVDTRDWTTKASAESVHAAVMKQLHPGAVILMHEIKPHTLEALPRIIADIRAQGYELVTVSKLIEEAAIAPPEVMSNGGGAMNEAPVAPQAIPIGDLKGMMQSPGKAKKVVQ